MQDVKKAAPATQVLGPHGKRDYLSPALRQYGVVSKMTQGSSGKAADNGTQVSRTPQSDRQTKVNIVRIDTHPVGFGLYLFDYKPEYSAATMRQFGVIAQEVENFVPQAVVMGSDGIRRVNYSLLGIEQSERVH